jgi:hypothetical protein
MKESRDAFEVWVGRGQSALWLGVCPPADFHAVSFEGINDLDPVFQVLYSEQQGLGKTQRGADLAIYVSSGREMLPQHVGDFQIYEDQIITTLEHLHIAYRLARLISTIQAPAGQIDVGALRGVLTKVRDAILSLRNVKSKASQIRNLADGVHDDATGTESRVIELLREAESILDEGALDAGAAA